MFILVELEDTIRVRAEDFGDVRLALRTELARHYTHRILNDVGLVVCVFDILHLGDPFVCMAADGTAQVTLRFRVVVFRPALGETLVGKVLASTPDGIQVSLDFTAAVFIPWTSLPSPSRLFVSYPFSFSLPSCRCCGVSHVLLLLHTLARTHSSPEEGMWYWSYEDHELWFETGQEVRFKVEEVRFHAPLEPPKKGIAAAAAAALPATPLLEQPMLVVGQAADSGLGMLAWWHQEPDDADGAAAEDDAAAAP